MLVKKKNPTDATLRNVRAANKKIKELDRRLTMLTTEFTRLMVRVKKLERR